MKNFTELGKEICQLESYISELTSENECSQEEAEMHIGFARNQLQVLHDQLQDLSDLLKTREQENLLLRNKLEEALKARNQLAAIGSSTEVHTIPDERSMTEDLIRVNKELNDEVIKIREELLKRESHLEELHKSYRTAEAVIIEENRLLKTENESMIVDVKNITSSYNRVKSDFLKNVETLRLMKFKLLEQKHFKQENENLKEENNKYHLENETLKKKLIDVQERFESYSVTLSSMSEKLNASNACFELNKKLSEEKCLLVKKVEENNLSIAFLNTELKNMESLFNRFEEEFKGQNEEIKSLKNKLELERRKTNDVTKLNKESIASVNNESNEYKKQFEEVSNQFVLYNEVYQEQMDLMNENHVSLTFSNIQYEIDVEYLKCVVNNQKNIILGLQNEKEGSIKPCVENKDMEVSAVVESCDVSTEPLIGESEIQIQNDLGIQIALDKVLHRIDTYKERNQNPCDGVDIIPDKDENQYITNVLALIDQKMSGLLSEVKEFFETSIVDLHKKYKTEAERQLSFSETSLAKLKYCYEKNLKHIKREHDEKVIRLLAAHEEEVRHMSLYQQNVHSIKEKLSKGKKKKNL